MTAKRGTQWKTSWRRQRPPVPRTPVPMWFFNGFGILGLATPRAEYRINPPSAGSGALPFWIGMVSAFDTPVVSDPLGGVYAALFENPRVIDDTSNSQSFGLTTSFNTVSAGTGATVPLSGAARRAVVTLATVVQDPSGPGTIVTLYIDANAGGPPQVATSPAPWPVGPGVVSKFYTFVRPVVVGGAFVNGWAGGDTVLTPAEITQWFADVRANLETADIPGKTSDRFSATSVAPTRPAILPNLAGGNPMTYVVSTAPDPVAINTLELVSFGY